MCIVVDINTLGCVLQESNSQHIEFRPVLEWIRKREGFLVLGGTTYMRELSKASRYLGIINQLKKAGMALTICDIAVDEFETKIKEMYRDQNCNDAHIIAILGASRCTLLCSADKRSYPYIKHPAWRPRRMGKVRIYSGLRSAGILNATNGRRRLTNVI